MPIAVFLKSILLGLLVSVPVGPVGVLCIQRTMNKGRTAGFITGLGAASADALYAIIAGFGLTFIMNFLDEQHFYLQLIGASIIMVIAVKIFYTNPAVQVRNHRRKKNSPIEDFITVFFLTFSNPAVVFIFVASFAGFNLVTDESMYYHVLMVIAGVFGGAMLWWYTLSSVVNRFRKNIRLKNLWWMNKIMGVIVFLFGLAAIVDLVIKSFR
jgi:threonine/homoserine/homoserine lactone efflux protein